MNIYVEIGSNILVEKLFREKIKKYIIVKPRDSLFRSELKTI